MLVNRPEGSGVRAGAGPPVYRTSLWSWYRRTVFTDDTATSNFAQVETVLTAAGCFCAALRIDFLSAPSAPRSKVKGQLS